MSLLARLEKWVRDCPDAVAVSSSDSAVTYGELWRASGRYKLWLERQGLGRRKLVAIDVGRRMQTIVALIGAMRAGAAYLPLSPSWPIERRNNLMSAAGATLVCSDDMSTAVQLTPDGSWHEEPPEADELIYVLYTSGTTGTPKGVPISDSNVCSMLDAALPHFTLGPDDVWAMSHLATFDFSVWEMWGALTTGARLELLTGAEVLHPNQLRARLSRSGVTVFSQVPSSFSFCLAEHIQALRNGEYAELRYLVFGGERVNLRDVADVLNASSGSLTAVNMYGITECSVHATFCELDRLTLDRWSDQRHTPIGQPLASHHVALYDARASADGTEIGELMLSGPAVSRGYWRDEELNSARFIADATDASTTWFRTGDIVSRTLDGELAYIERRDAQVKVMGYRIDCSEIERHARQLTGVSACAAFSTQVRGRDKLALAYVSDPDITPTQVADHLRRVLPAYMVPTHVQRTNSMPVTESGKVDRAFLQRRAASAPTS